MRRLLTLMILMPLLSGCQTVPAEFYPVIEKTEHRPRTSDGWALAVSRYRRTKEFEGPVADRLPVVLCHGLSCNARYWDLTDSVSLAQFLARKGYDVWVPSLRGAGQSAKPGYFVVRQMLALKLPNVEQMLNLPTIVNPRANNWTFDDYAFKDLPAILDEVKKTTGKDRVLWVGHSMGGMAMFAYLEQSGRDDVAGFVALGSPIHIPQPPNEVYALAVNNRTLFRMGQGLLSAQVGARISSIPGYTMLDSFYYNRRNMDTEVVRLFLRDVVEDVPDGVIEQLLTVAGTGDLKSADGKVNYTAGLSAVRTPMLFLAGSSDKMSEPAGVRYAFDHVSSTDKTYVELGADHGFSADYGHMDLVLGKKSQQEVFPLLLAWLGRHDIFVPTPVPEPQSPNE